MSSSQDGRRGAEWDDGVMCFRKEAPSERKSAKAASAGKAAKDGEKTPKASKSIAADKEEAASAFDFDDEGVEAPAAKKQRSTPAAKGDSVELFVWLWASFWWPALEAGLKLSRSFCCGESAMWK